jgi:hypothetical protein
MDEIKFVIKNLIVTVVLLLALQVKVGANTLEYQAITLIETSSVTRYLQNVAQGAVLAIRNAGKATSDFVSRTFQQQETQRASRFNMEFKRSPQSAANK